MWIKIAVCGKGDLLPTTLLSFINERQCIEGMLLLHSHLPTR